MTFQKFRPETEEEWLALRKEYITATEVSSILGVNQYQSATKMWDNKTHSTFRGNSYTFIGQLLEPIVVEMTNTALDKNFSLYEVKGGPKLFLGDSKLKIGATPDAGDDTDILECKTTQPRSFMRYQTFPPINYIVQVATQLLLDYTKEKGYLAIMNTDLSQESPELRLPLAIFEVNRSDALQKLIISEVERFWQSREDNKVFRSREKKQTTILCHMCCTKLL